MIRRRIRAGWVVGLVVLATPASASPDLSEEWGQVASTLYEQTVETMRGAPLPDGYEADTARFAATAARLADWAEASGAAADFDCIFRGMTEEADVQLDALGTHADGEAPLQRLAILFSDAEAIAAAAVHASRRPGTAGPGQAPTCPASPSTAQYLTEQP